MKYLYLLDSLKFVKDPEKCATLEELGVISEDTIKVNLIC